MKPLLPGRTLPGALLCGRRAVGRGLPLGGLALWAGVAWGAPDGSAHASLRVGSDDAVAGPDGSPAGDRAVGLGAAVSLPLRPGLALDGVLQGLVGGDPGPTAELRPELVLGPRPWQTGPLVLVGGGLSLGGRQAAPGAPWAHAVAGLGWQHALGPAGGLRSVARLHLRDSLRAELALGWAWGRPPVDAPPPPPPPPPTVDLSQLPPDAEIWIPHPWCYWLPLDEAAAIVPTLPPAAQLRIQARSHDPAVATPRTVGGITLRPASAQGAVLVVGAPGDVVQVGDTAVPTEADGVAVLNMAAGPATLTVVGGGRAQRFEVSIEDGHALWLRAAPPDAALVRFAVGSAELEPEARAQLVALAQNAGGWRLAVEGGFSPEGDRADNLRLAEARAAAVREALLAAGLPPERVVLRPPAVPEGGTDAAARRVAVVVPLAPGDSP